MADDFIVTPEAHQDIDAAYTWYEARRVGLGEEFLTHLDARIQIILRYPESCPLVQGNYRRAIVRRFPYSIFYEYEAGVVTVYGIFHHARNPEKWRDLLR